MRDLGPAWRAHRGLRRFSTALGVGAVYATVSLDRDPRMPGSVAVLQAWAPDRGCKGDVLRYGLAPFKSHDLGLSEPHSFTRRFHL